MLLTDSPDQRHLNIELTSGTWKKSSMLAIDNFLYHPKTPRLAYYQLTLTQTNASIFSAQTPFNCVVNWGQTLITPSLHY